MKKKLSKGMKEFFEEIFKEPKIVKTYPLKPEWKRVHSEIHKRSEVLEKEQQAIFKEVKKFWQTIEKATKDKRLMRLNHKKSVIEVLE